MKRWLLCLCLAGSACAAELSISRTTLAAFDATEDWVANATLTAATDADDTTHILHGAQSYTVTTNSNSTALSRLLAAGVVKNKATLWVYVTAADLANLRLIGLRFYNTYGTDHFVHYVYGVTTPRQSLIADRWCPLELYEGAGTVTGAAWDGTGYTYEAIELQVDRVDDGPNTSVSFGWLTTDSANKGGVVWTFDDGWDGVYDYAYPVLKAQGWQGVVAVVEDLVGDAGYMTAAELGELYDDGWDLVAHSKTHPTMDGRTLAQAVTELSSVSAYLYTQGWVRGARIWAWPANTGVDTGNDWYGIDQARPYYDIMRGAAHSLAVPNALVGMEDVGSAWEPVSWQQLTFYGLDVDTDDTFADDYQVAFQAIIDRHGVINIYSHDIGAGLTGVHMDIPMLTDTVAWLKAQEAAGALDVLTVTQWYEAATESRHTDKPRGLLPPPYDSRSRYAGEEFLDVD